MSIGQVRTPAVYTEINTNTQRTGLAGQNHKIVFITQDTPVVPSSVPVSVYDKTSADVQFGADSEAGKMMATAVQVSQGVNVQVLGK